MPEWYDEEWKEAVAGHLDVVIGIERSAIADTHKWMKSNRMFLALGYALLAIDLGAIASAVYRRNWPAVIGFMVAVGMAGWVVWSSYRHRKWILTVRAEWQERLEHDMLRRTEVDLL